MSFNQTSVLSQILGLEAVEEIDEAERVIAMDDNDDDEEPELDHEAVMNDLFLSKHSSERRTSVTLTRKSTVKVKVQLSETLATINEERLAGRVLPTPTRRQVSMRVDLSSESDEEEVKRLDKAKNQSGKMGELEISSDDSSDKEQNPLDGKILEIAQKFDGAAIKFGTALQVKIYDLAPPTTLVEMNENQKQQAQYKRIKAQSLLPNFDKDLYDLKRSIFQIIELPRISKQVFEDKGQAYFGKISCIRLFNAKNGHMVFLGNSAGYIQIFDIKSQKQLKPLFDVSLAKNEVTCIEISKDGHYLLAGYKQGILALWDCARFRLAHLMRDVAKDENSTFSIVRIFQTQTPDQINIATVEKESGRMCRVTLMRQFLGKYSHQITIQEEKNVNALEVKRPSICNDSLFSKELNFAAYSVLEIVKVVDLKDEDRIFKIIERPSLCSDQASAILSWGYGITPADKNQSKPLLAVTWDKIIKLMTVNEQTQDLETSGFYCSDQEINQVYFVSDSLIAILVNADHVKLLCTEKFKSGTPDDLVQNKQSHETIKEFKAAIQSCKACELESLPIGDNMKRATNPNLRRRAAVVLNLDMILTSQKLSQIDYQNSMCFYKQSLALLCRDKILLVKLLSWKDFMESLVIQQGADWLTILKTAIDIYSGEIKGFAQLPAAKEQRQVYMQAYMKTLIFDSIQNVVKRYYQDGTSQESPKNNLNYQQIGEVAIKVAIEFCLTIQEVEFLFGDMQKLFVERELEDQFVVHLCQPIIAGQFVNDYVPEEIILKLIQAKEQENDTQAIEQIILNVNLDPYEDKFCQGGKPVLTALTEVAKKFCLVAAALKLIQSSTRIRAISEADSPEKKLSVPSHVHQQKKSMNLVLDMLLNRMETQKAKIEQAMDKNEKIVQITREDLRLLRNANRETKSAVEKSCYYLGYHFFWILGLFLKGRKFPSGTLDSIQYKLQVLNIVDFVTNENNLCAMLDFDAETFFITMVALFSGKPWFFITHAGNYKFKYLKKTMEQKEDITICKNPIANRILGIFKLTAERFSRKEPNFCKATFQEFVLRVIIQQEKELDHEKSRKTQGFTDKADFENDIVLTCLKGAFKAKSHGEKSVVGAGIKYEIDQQLIIDALRASQITEHEHLDQMIELANMAHQNTKKDMFKVKIQLYENKEEYYQAFMQHFNHDNKGDEIFKWIDKTFEKLKSQELKWKMEQGFKDFFTIEIQKQKEEQKVSKNQKQDQSDSDHSDRETQEKLMKVQSEVLFQEDTNPYPPLAKLRQTIKDRMLKLAQYNSERTMQLIDEHFSEGDFQEKFIMNQFSKFPEQQLAYLKTFITNNEKEIEITMQDTLTSRTAAAKYERYLVQFTKLLCKYDPKSVDQWVSKSYFPVLKCLSVCKDARNMLGEAVLTMRNGRPHDAIDVYTQTLTEFNILHLLDQIKLLYKDEPSFLQNYMLEEDQDLDEDLILTKKNQKSSNTFALSQIADFDSIIGKACQICMLDELDIEERQKGWFKILRYLQNFQKDAEQKCDSAIKTALEIVGSSKYSSINEKNKQSFVEKLQKFITVRINYILKFPGLMIPLKQLVEQFQMSVDQIKQLTIHRMKNSDINFKIESTQNTLMKGQSCDIYNELLQKLGNGYIVEPVKRLQPNSIGRKKCFAQSICSVCVVSICAIPEIVIFGCGHYFHQKCLTQRQIQNDSKSCPVCLKVNFMVIREDFEKRLRKNSKIVDQEEDESDQLDLVREESRIKTIFNEEEEEESMQKMKLNMLSKKFDQFDLILDDINLELREFEEARF